MIVNQELLEIYKSLKFIIENCKENSTIIIVTFHSLEDLLVKRIINFYGKKTSISRYLPQVSDVKKMPIKIKYIFSFVMVSLLGSLTFALPIPVKHNEKAQSFVDPNKFKKILDLNTLKMKIRYALGKI